MARIRFCIAESMLGVVTGEVGVGKTVAVAHDLAWRDDAGALLRRWDAALASEG